MEVILNEKDFYKNVREVITLQILNKAKECNIIDETNIKKIMKELNKVEVINYASNC